MTKSPMFNFVFGSVLGLAMGISLALGVSHPVSAGAPPDVQAATIEAQKETIAKMQQQLDMREKAIVTMSNEMQAAMTNPGAQLLARSGHIMNEAQCRAWDSATNPMAASERVVQ
jgi:hypothetical protein